MIKKKNLNREKRADLIACSKKQNMKNKNQNNINSLKKKHINTTTRIKAQSFFVKFSIIKLLKK